MNILDYVAIAALCISLMVMFYQAMYKEEPIKKKKPKSQETYPDLADRLAKEEEHIKEAYKQLKIQEDIPALMREYESTIWWRGYHVGRGDTIMHYEREARQNKGE